MRLPPDVVIWGDGNSDFSDFPGAATIRNGRAIRFTWTGLKPGWLDPELTYYVKF